ncbi:hypothetical protein [Streptomyces sp. NPDC048639]|uniref:hypothetical protein n=1 Tax=Streptomyces sp. NPDC048639 TaxID=3365581 RepID=UPI0037188DCA
MSVNSTHQACDHPARDIAIVALGSIVVALVAAVVMVAFNARALAVFAASGTSLAASLGVGMNILSHVKRGAQPK